ncbi:MAG: 16S rRNA (adenine(1518)-N(6)/adenine(1519)-N(6))-dimethyltransferase RsmA [Oscillospiraceae bacterium]|nr:16S rRNA (adenine(1518)-N(6)/adenine(1519)-N(6))-dimethyltransferase RsmA [Oscillospiraceae bacterium]
MQKNYYENISHRPKKQLGQNFLINPGIVSKITLAGPIDQQTGVIEIGAGRGVLTEQLAKAAKKVLAIEIDKALVSDLSETFAVSDRVVVVEGDILKLNLSDIIKQYLEGMKVAVYGNLPYYITSSIVMKLLEERFPFEYIVVMMQKETALRFTAAEGSRLSGAVTLAVRYYSQPHYLFDVSSGSFYPKPNVDSAVVRFDLHSIPPVTVNNESLMFDIIKAAFMQRRKTAVNAISDKLPIAKSLLIDIFRQIDIDQLVRAEQLTLKDYAIISDRIEMHM